MANQLTTKQIQDTYTIAKERYATLGVDTGKAMEHLAQISISLHCWQGDDGGGFEDPDRGLSGGIMTTGNYPGKASTAAELRQDLDKAYNLIPGYHRLNLHAIYEELKGLPFGAVWDYYCWQQDVPIGITFMDEIRAYEAQVLSQRG